MEKKPGNERKRKYSGKQIQDFAELSVGDFVVHENHGLGIYRGIEKVEVDHVVKDYMKIEYSGGSNLYIQATQLDALQKYAGADARAPKLNRLGGPGMEQDKDPGAGCSKEYCKRTGGTVCYASTDGRVFFWRRHHMAEGI